MKDKQRNLNQLKTYLKVFVERDRKTGNVLEIEQEKYIEDGEKKIKTYRIPDIVAMNHNDSNFMKGDAQEMFVTEEELSKLKKEAGISEVKTNKADAKLAAENKSLLEEIAKLKGETKETPKAEVKEDPKEEPKKETKVETKK